MVERKLARTHLPQEKKRLGEQKIKAEEEKIAKGREVKFQEKEDNNDPLTSPFYVRFFVTIKTPKRFTTMVSPLRRRKRGRRRRGSQNLHHSLQPLPHLPQVLLLQ